MNKRKRAVSPVISTILLIMIVIVLAVIILVWANSFIKEAVTKTIDSKEKTIEQWCQDIKITPEISSTKTSFGFTNEGSIPIFQYQLKLVDIDSGDSELKLVHSAQGGSVNPGFSSVIEEDNLLEIKTYREYQSIKLIPILLGEGRGKNNAGKQEVLCPEKLAIILK